METSKFLLYDMHDAQSMTLLCADDQVPKVCLATPMTRHICAAKVCNADSWDAGARQLEQPATESQNDVAQ